MRVCSRQAFQQHLGELADVLHMPGQAPLAVAELHDLAQHAHQHGGVLFLFADLVRHQRHQPPLLGVQFDGVVHAAVYHLGGEGAVHIVRSAHLVGPADGFLRVLAGDHDHRTSSMVWLRVMKSSTAKPSMPGMIRSSSTRAMSPLYWLSRSSASSPLAASRMR